MKSNFTIILRRVRYKSAQFPDAEEQLNREYDNLIQYLQKHRLKKNLKQFCITENEFIKVEQNRIFEWLRGLQKQDFEKLTYDEVIALDKEIQYYSGILAWCDDARAHLLEYLAGYHPEVFNTSEKIKGLKDFLKFSPVVQKIALPPQPIVKQKPELKIDQIALKYAYEGLQITRENGNKIAKKYGHNSGEKLFQRFTYFSSPANRKGKPTLCTPRKLDNKIKLIESIIELLPTDKQERAKDEVSILKKIYEAEY